MSLVNDALKRAGKAQQQAAANDPQTAPVPLPPAPGAAKPVGPISWPLILIVGAMLLLAGWFLHSWWEANRATEELAALHRAGQGPGPVDSVRAAAAALSARPDPSRSIATDRNQPVAVTPVPEQQTAPPAVAPSASPVPAISPAEPPPARLQSPAVATPAPAAAPAVATPAPATELRLQGIFYRLKDPSVIINGRTLYVGQERDGVRVVAINRMDATVLVGGERRVLRIEP